MAGKNIWNHLVNETKKDSKPKYRKPILSGVTDVFYTVDKVTFGRSILIEINTAEKNKVPKLPEINGWFSSAVKKTIDGSSKYYLQISERSVDTRKIAEMVIGDLTDNLKSLTQRDQLLDTVISTMKQWQLFFQSKGIMPFKDEQGLVGELSWMLEMMKQKENPRMVVEAWCGPDRARHDYEFDDTHFEIKTTSRKDRFIKISSQHQLNHKGLKHLYLSVYKYNVVKSNKPTLPILYDKIMKIVSSDEDLKSKIETFCGRIGYNNKKRKKHENKFIEDGIVQVYKVNFSFPKILLTPKMVGIHNVSYSLDLGVCSSHEKKLSEIFPI